MKFVIYSKEKFALQHRMEINTSRFTHISGKHMKFVDAGKKELAQVQATNPRARRDHNGQNH